MKTPPPAKKPAKKYGPGEYKPDIEYKRIEDLPKAKVIKENRNETQRQCSLCGQSARREHTYQRQLHDDRVFVPFATIQNWVEDGGEKGKRTLGKRLSGLGPHRLFRLSGC